MGASFDDAVIKTCHTAGSRREVEKQSGWEDDEYRRVGDCSDERLSLTSCESGVHSKFTRPLKIPTLAFPRALRPNSCLQVERPRSARAARCRSIFCHHVVIVALSPYPTTAEESSMFEAEGVAAHPRRQVPRGHSLAAREFFSSLSHRLYPDPFSNVSDEYVARCARS